LLEVTKADAWEEWILYIVAGIEQTAQWTREKIEAVRQLLEHTTSYVKEQEPKIYSYELVSLIFELPYCRIQNVVDAGLAQRQSASRYMKALVQLGVLEEIAKGREKLFVHPKYLRLLSEDSNHVEPYRERK
jgi:Fic family protein